MSILSSMDLPTIDVDLGPEKIEEVKVGGPVFHCDLCDTEVVHKLAQMFLPGLASACVDNTSGDLFKSPGSVAVDFRKEMIQYLTQRSESFVAESIILEGGGGPDGEVLDHPFDIISNFVDDFATSKRNLFTRVSEWALSEKREDKIDDFIQEIEMNGFWTLDRREAIAQTLLKNVDFNNSFHCTETFHSSQDLANHVHTCNFRPMICQNQGCNARFCAGHLNDHDSICPFKIIQCEQRCSESIMRRDMDRHCITVCTMKLVNCPFYAMGCRSAVAQCLIEKHCLDDVQSHLWHLLKGIYKDASGEVLKRRVEQIVQASPSSNLSRARDVRSLNFIVKDVEAKLGPLEVGIVQKTSAETIAKNDEREDLDSDTNVTNTNGCEQTTQASDIVNSSDNAGVSVNLTTLTAETTGKSEESEYSDTGKKISEERIQTSDTTNLPDKDKIDPVNEGNALIYGEEKDAATGDLKFKGTKESSLTNVEIDPVNEGSALIYGEEKDAATGDLKFKGNKESTLTNVEISAEEINATNGDSAQNCIISRHIEDGNLGDKDNVERIQISEMETMGSAENDVKNKDTEDDNLKERTQTLAV